MSRRLSLTNLTFGADPECFIYDTKANHVKSAVKLIPGTKEEPYEVKELGKGYAMQTDNILAEFNIPPAKTVQGFVDNVAKMREYIRNFVKSIDEKYDILCTASQRVPKSELRSKQAKQYGCDADYCVYTGDVNPKPANAAKDNLRSGGLHLHIGYDGPTIDRSLRLLRYLDAYIGLPSILIDKDTERRTLYGQAGCFRLVPYGVEYRTLSSFFLKDDRHVKWMADQALKAINAYNHEYSLPVGEKVQYAINNNDIELAKTLCEEYCLCDDFIEE